MKREYRRQVAQYSRRSRYRHLWQKIVQIMACIVVFCTTYALILPAITIEQTYFCGMEEHGHTETCYTHEAVTTYVCSLDGDETHQHTEECQNVIIEDTLICQIQEHIHEKSCQPDPEADIETAETWESTLAHVELSGEWQRDLLAIAQSQIGYEESDRNYLCEDGVTRKGYTRYGAWYGVPYGNWDTMFVSFCLNYAKIPEEVISQASNSQQLVEQLQTLGLWSEPEAYVPEIGDLVFFENGESAAILPGIVSALDTEVDVATGESKLSQIRVITGGIEDRVGERSVALEDILGGCSIENAQQQYTANYAQQEEAAESTETAESAETAESTESSESVEATETEAVEVELQTVTQTAETENYIVNVTYNADLMLPEGAQLRVTEYAKDSDIFRQRCEEAGYELEWLLNIGFFLGEQEIDLDGAFAVVVTGKQMQELGSDITHFADSGAERIEGSSETSDGQASVSFSADGFSDFGGGIATVAAGDNATVTLDFTSYNQWCPINFPSGNTYTCQIGSTITIVLNDSGANYSEAQIAVTGGEVVSKTYSCGDSSHSSGHTNWCGSNPTHTIVVKATAANVTITGSVGGAAWNGSNSVTISDQESGGTTPDNPDSGPTDPVESEEPDQLANTVPSYPYHPHAVHTGTVEISRLRFYNLCENGDSGVSPLAGCVFEITGENGYKKTVVSGDSIEIHLPDDIPDGTYTIKEISAPEGYMRDTDFERTFQVKGGALVSTNNIGTFINHSLEQLQADKTGEVEDYNNRIYQILLSAESHMRMYEMDPVDVLFVVDQSNSMLFPSGLEETGKSVTLRLDGRNNIRNMEAQNLDKNQMYYIISDPQGTSTVWCLWYNGQSWIYQDASYYAKAKHNNAEGYQDPSEKAIFPENRSYADQKNADGTGNRSNGGGLGFSLSGSGLGKDIDKEANDTKTYKIYTATGEFNRLHYLEQSLANMIYELADVNSQNRVMLTEFTKVADENDCYGPLELTPENADFLVDKVRHINTSGGTRQDIALKHVYENHLNVASEGFSGDPNYTYTILVTDGAPVLSGGSDLTNLGSPNDAASTTADSVYAQIKGYAQQVRRKSTLMTVGLGMDDVEAGKQVLKEIASADNFNCALDDAAQLVKTMQELLFDAFRPKDTIHLQGDVVDEISDSFYPIAWVSSGAGAGTGRRVLLQDSDQDWILLETGDWITLEGKYTTAGASDAAGQLLQKEDGTFYVQWKNVPLSDPYLSEIERIAWVPAGTNTGRTVVKSDGTKDWILLNEGDYITQEGKYHSGYLNSWQARSYGRVTRNGEDYSITWGSYASGANRVMYDPDLWHGTFYVKAKEDFIGGNAILTNKSAKVTTNDAAKVLESPTVNVRLLDMNEMHSEVTVYLGDTVNEAGNAPIDSLQYFYGNTKITKLIADGGDVLNKITADSEKGLEEAVFYLRYAIGRDLTVDEWNALKNGQSIILPYTYDSASSRGPVGYFTFRLTQTGIEGANPSYEEHTATAACQPGGQPLTEHCDAPAETYTLHVSYTAYRLGENGRPTANVHNSGQGPGTEVGTGSTLETGLGVVAKENVHEVHVISGKIEISKKFAEGVTSKDDQTFTFIVHRLEDGEDTSRDVSKTITIPANSTRSTVPITFDNLRRGTYTVKEVQHESYMMKSITVLNSTNCYSTPAIGGSAKEVMFVMGNNIANEDVIGRRTETDRFTSFIDPVNGVFGAAEFTNDIYKGEIPVQKIWSDGAENHTLDAVYVILYKDNAPALDDNGRAKLLRLEASNQWQGIFEVIIQDKNDELSTYNYSVREASEVSGDSQYQGSWQTAVLVNDGDAIVYYKGAVENGDITWINTKGYMVQYEAEATGGWIITNIPAVELPMTGGMGTKPFTISGLLLLTAGLIYGCSQRRKRERRASD